MTTKDGSIEHRTIELKTKKELEIFMNPSRQKILRLLSLSEEPMTAKALSREMGVSASSAQHHIKLLEQLELVNVHHTALINGITATYYTDGYYTVRIGMEGDELNNEREALALQVLQDVWNGFTDAMRKRHKVMTPEQRLEHAEMLSGVVHLTPQDWKNLQGIMTEYLRSHEHPREDTTPWEYAFLAYDTKIAQEEQDEA